MEVFERIHLHNIQSGDLVKARYFINTHPLSEFVEKIFPIIFKNFNETIDSCFYEELINLAHDLEYEYGDDKIKVMVAYINNRIDFLLAKKKSMRFVLTEEERRSMRMDSEVLAMESAKAKNIARIKASFRL